MRSRLLPNGDEWETFPDSLRYAKEEGWLVFVTPPDDREDEAPADLLVLRPSLRYCVGVTLEPIGAEGGYEFWDRVTKALATGLDGATWDVFSGKPFVGEE